MSDTRAMPEAVIQAAWMAAFPGLPECIGFDESKRRATNAAQVAWDAALASVPPVPDNTELIAKAREWVQEENWESSYETDGHNAPGTELIVELTAALEFLSATTQQENN